MLFATAPDLAASASYALFSIDSLIALLTLTSLEVILGIDNIIVISIITGRLPEAQRPLARNLGLGLAMLMRIMLLLFIGWIMTLTVPLITMMGKGFSGKDLILLIGGLFLIGKATYEIHHKMEGPEAHGQGTGAVAAASFGKAIATILAVDLVFSLDSVITAVGMVKHIPIMIAAVMLSVGFMFIFAGPISHFIERHPTIKILALSFLLLIGVLLTAEGMGVHMDKKFIYFAMGFSLIVELINLRVIDKYHGQAAH